MAIEEKQQTPEQKEAAKADQAQRESAFAKDLIKKFDLPTGLQDAVETAEEKKSKKEAAEESEAEETEQETETEETTEEESTEEAGESEESEESETETGEAESTEESEETEEEADPKTKSAMQKRIDELTAKNKRLESKLNAREKGEETTKETDDPDRAKLEKMSVEELNNLKRRVKIAWKNEADTEKAAQLMDLEEKIDETIRTTPQRFQTKQLNAFYAAAQETAEELGDKFDTATAKKIKAIAEGIFSKSRVLQGSVDGQAEAWRQAVDRYKEVSKLSSGKSDALETKRKLNTLKKKVSLDTALQKGNTKVSEEAKLHRRAQTGTSDDKAAFIRKKFNTDSLVPEELRQPR